ncbi:MAG: hypothetical protein RQ982_06630, partial [Gammaproteobacteria bacterium]|nr:hypothetical protein [Gammaproteobacteria bacterium]
HKYMNAIPFIQRVVAVLWPAFIMAGIATILLTSAFDPSVIFVEHDISRLGFYTIIFFVFWIFGISTAAATCYFLKPCEAMNKARERAKVEAIEVATEAARNVAQEKADSTDTGSAK